jgi:hypothetical protein
MSKNVRIRGYFSKPNGIRAKKFGKQWSRASSDTPFLALSPPPQPLALSSMEKRKQGQITKFHRNAYVTAFCMQTVGLNIHKVVLEEYVTDDESKL